MIKRKHSNKVLSKIVATDSLVFLSGQVASDSSLDVKAQTKQVLEKIDSLLKEENTDKYKLLSVTVWLSDIREKDAMNEAWLNWIEAENTPARACVEARLATPELKVEMQVIAAK